MERNEEEIYNFAIVYPSYIKTLHNVKMCWDVGGGGGGRGV